MHHPLQLIAKYSRLVVSSIGRLGVIWRQNLDKRKQKSPPCLLFFLPLLEVKRSDLKCRCSSGKIGSPEYIGFSALILLLSRSSSEETLYT